MTDEVTAQAVNVTPSTSKPHSSFRLVFFVLLIATLLSATASAYILMNWKLENPETAMTTQTQEENVFVEDTTTNPFEEEVVSEIETETPFAGDTSTNPFAAYITESESGSSDEYTNPF